MTYDELLRQAEKPARYTGGEYNSTAKRDAALKFLICFPDVYEVAMSNLGWKLLYHELNEMTEVLCERCFAPFPDFGDKLRAHGVPLCSLESRRKMTDFDIVGFSLQFELCYTNVLYMLELGGIPFRASERGAEYPLIVAGGPCAYNVEPVADFFDLFMIGEGEDCIRALSLLKLECKTKDELLERAAREIEGVYVPKFVRPVYASGKLSRIESDYPVKKAAVRDLDKSFYPEKMIVPNIAVVHDRAVCEVFRGCTRGCRFCQAGFTYRPIRFKSPETVVEQVKAVTASTGFEEVSLSSLSTGDYPHLLEVLDGLREYAKERDLHLQLPSLRLDSYLGEYSDDARKSSLTFAPEAGSQRLRDVINKNITESDIESSLIAAFSRGFATIKLYFMIGLPTETDEDVLAIRDIVTLAKDLYRAHAASKKSLRISVSASTFVPKPFTPFQWEKQASRAEIEHKQELLRRALRMPGVTLSWNDYDTSEMEALFSRGDRRLSEVLERAYRKGSRFDGWREYFKPENFRDALSECGLSAEDFTRAYEEEEPLCWEFVDIGIPKRFLWRERERAYRGETTSDCKTSCKGCGANRRGGCDLCPGGEKC